MTGVAFCSLSHTIQDQCNIPPLESSSKFALWEYNSEDSSFPRNLYGRNKLYFHLSPFTIDLESPDSDPLGSSMSHDSTYRVANISPSVTSREIIDCLSGLVDSRNQPVTFEIIWIDDTTFLIGAQIVGFQNDNERFKEHGSLLFEVLKNKFCNNESITLLCPSVETPKSIWNLWGLWGDRKSETDDNQRPLKRRRLP